MRRSNEEKDKKFHKEMSTHVTIKVAALSKGKDTMPKRQACVKVFDQR